MLKISARNKIKIVASVAVVMAVALVSPSMLSAGPESGVDINDFVTFTVNGSESTTGTLPHAVEFEISVDWDASDAAYKHPGTEYYLDFGDSADLNDDNCDRIDDDYQYKDLICDQPLEGISITREDGDTVTVIHTYVYDDTFTPTLSSVKKGRNREETIDIERSVVVTLPEVVVAGDPLTGAVGSARTFTAMCPTMFEFGYIEVSGDRDSVINTDLELRGDKLFYIGAMDNLQNITTPLAPESDTSLTVACRPVGLTDEIFNKYVRYQRYLNYNLPDTQYIYNNITYMVDETPEEEEEEETCEETAPVCRVNSITGQDYVEVKNIGGVCGVVHEQACQNGCSDGACLSSDQCVSTRVCAGNSVVDSCTGDIIEQCTDGGCYGGFCTNQPGGDPMTAARNLVANPGIILKGGTTRISWDVENALSCSVTGGDNDWSDLRSPVEGYETTPLQQTTDFVLECTDFDGNTINQSVTVRIAPTWQEL